MGCASRGVMPLWPELESPTFAQPYRQHAGYYGLELGLRLGEGVRFVFKCSSHRIKVVWHFHPVFHGVCGNFINSLHQAGGHQPK
jgi:hypothetical protein